ncbi:MAG TPA: hypothetical protein P5057_12045, partial [Acidobacteriota bacterium]|nr:hypothetical protein [Acidobacteriota bacterium]
TEIEDDLPGFQIGQRGGVAATQGSEDSFLGKLRNLRSRVEVTCDRVLSRLNLGGVVPAA